MATRQQDTVNKIASTFDTWKKILGPLVIIGGAVVSFTIAWIEIKESKAKIQQMDVTYKQMIQEMIKDNKAQMDDQHELIIKNIQSINSVKQAFNDHEISAAEFRGRVKQILKIQ